MDLELTDEARLSARLDPGIPLVSVQCPSTGVTGVCYCAKIFTWVLVMERRSSCFPSKNLTEFSLQPLKVYLLIKIIANQLVDQKMIAGVGAIIAIHKT